MKRKIESRENPFFKDLQECLESKGIRKHGLFMIFGRRAVDDTLKTHAPKARGLILCNGRHDPDSYSAATWELAKSLFDELDVFGTGHPILLMNAPTLASADLSLAPQGLEVLCALGDPSNVGAVLRSAAAFGASKVILLKESASPFHPRAVRAASSTTLTTPLERGPSIQDLREDHVIALDMGGTPLSSFVWPRNVRLLIGEEGRGIPENIAFQRLSIPMREGVESLNAAVSASIALYAYRAAQR